MIKTNNKNKKYLLIIFLLGTTFFVKGQILPEWADTIGGLNPNYSQFEASMVGDVYGNTYVATSQCDTNNSCSLVLGKYNSAGTLLFLIDTLQGQAQRVSICIDDSMNLYAACLNSFTYQLTILKYNTTGNLIWSSTSAAQSGLYFRGFRTHIVTDDSTNIYVTGEGDSIPGYGEHIVTMKFNANGVFQWGNKYYYGDGYMEIGLDGAQNVYISGRSWDTLANTFNVGLIKYSSAGVLLWDSHYNSAGSFAAPIKMVVSPTGNCYIGGSDGSGNGDLLIVKFDSSGNNSWSEIYSAGIATVAGDVLTDIKIDAAENIYVTGTLVANSQPDEDFLTLKYDSAGSLLWSRIYNASSGNFSFEYSNSLCIDNLNNVYVTGEHFNVLTNRIELITIKYNTNGDTLWTAKYYYNDTFGYQSFKCACDGANNLYLSGLHYSTAVIGNPYNNILTLKYGFSSGLEESISQGNNLFIYPNPVTTMLSVALNKKETITITDLSGKVVIQNNFPNTAPQHLELNVSELTPGMYFINTGSAFAKFVKE